MRILDRTGGRADVADIQRARMVAALVDVVTERGVAQTTVAHVVARSGVSRRTFYELFEDRDACLLAAFDAAVQRAAARVLPAYQQATGGARGQMEAALQALLEFLEDEPALGAFCVVDALAGGPVVLEHRAEVVRVLVDAVDECRARARGTLRPTRLIAEGVVGAVLGVLHTRLVESRREAAVGPAAGRESDTLPRGPRASTPPMLDLLGPLMAMIVLPYEGQAAAARELARPAPRRRRVAQPQSDPLRDLDMRLTYRTVRVLLAIAEHPGASNREVSDAAGVQDQGQISKLLARLEHLGLIRNREQRPSRGEPNGWRLTPRGMEIEHTIRRRTIAAA